MAGALKTYSGWWLLEVADQKKNKKEKKYWNVEEVFVVKHSLPVEVTKSINFNSIKPRKVVMHFW